MVWNICLQRVFSSVFWDLKLSSGLRLTFMTTHLF